MTSAGREQLAEDEGLRLKPYVDTVGKVTIGIGRNLDDVGISRAEALLLFENDLVEVEQDLATFPWYARLDPVRRDVLVNLRFNLGPSRFRGFRHMLAAVARGAWETAAAELLDSRWATQVQGSRRDRLVRQLRDGQ